MEEIFTAREQFKSRIFRNIQGELDQFGLKIYNANVKELRDAPNSSYFESLSRKAHEGAINQGTLIPILSYYCLVCELQNWELSGELACKRVIFVCCS